MSSPSSYSSHYNEIADQYDQLFYWQVESQDNQGIYDKFIQILNLTDNDIIADIGCGNATTLRRLAEILKPKNNYIAVDPCEKFIQNIKRQHDFQTFLLDADGFANENIHYDAIILRNMLHHLGNQEDIKSCFQRFYHQLNDGGRVLIVTTSKSLYPVVCDDEEIIQRRSIDEQGFTDLTKTLEDCGFRVKHFTEATPAWVKSDQYRTMLRARFLTTLRHVNDERIEQFVDKVADIEQDGMVRWTHEEDYYVLHKI